MKTKRTLKDMVWLFSLIAFAVFRTSQIVLASAAIAPLGVILMASDPGQAAAILYQNITPIAGWAIVMNFVLILGEWLMKSVIPSPQRKEDHG